jgi:hypothetical protein
MTDWLSTPWIHDTLRTLSDRLPTLGIALGILIGGWLVAYVVQRMAFAALQRTTIDDKIAALVGMETGGEHGSRVERFVAKTIYYALLAFVLVAFFGYLKIDAVTLPLVTLLNQLTGAIPNVLKALVFGVGGYLLAKGIRRLVLAVLERVDFEKRVTKLAGDLDELDAREAKKKGKKVTERQPFSTTLADVAYWFVLVVVSIPVLEALQISALAGPLSSALATITAYLPRVGGAAVLLVVGWLVSRAVRAVVSGVLSKIGLDRVVSRLGFGSVVREHPLSGAVGTIVMVFVFLQFAIAAVGRLELAEISVPLSQTLEKVYGYLPKIFVGSLVLALGVVLARVAGNLSARLLAAVGFNSFVAHLGLFRDEAAGKRQEDESRQVVEKGLHRLESEEAAGPKSGGEEDQLLGEHGTKGIKTPADVAGLAVGAVVVLLFLKQSLVTLELVSLSAMLDRLVEFLPHVVASLVVLGAGLWAGAWAHKRVDELIAQSEDRLLKALGPVAHVVLVTFAAMVAVQQLGVGAQLIAIAFGVLLGAVCLALALAFGLGGREVAGKILAEEYEKRRKK